MYDSRRLRGWNLFTGGSLVTCASILVRLQAKQDGGDYVLAFSTKKKMLCMILACCAGGTGFAGGSLVTFASILVRLQAKREGGDFVLGFFDEVMLCMVLAGCAGGTGLPAAL